MSIKEVKSVGNIRFPDSQQSLIKIGQQVKETDERTLERINHSSPKVKMMSSE